MRQRPIGAAARHLRGVGDRLGKVGEAGRHLGSGREVVLGGDLSPIVHGEIAARRDAQQRVVGLVQVGRGEVGLVGRHQRQAARVGLLDQPAFGLALGVEPVALKLHVEAVAERRGEPVEQRGRLLAPAGDHEAVERAVRPAGQRDQSVRAR